MAINRTKLNQWSSFKITNLLFSFVSESDRWPKTRYWLVAYDTSLYINRRKFPYIH